MLRNDDLALETLRAFVAEYSTLADAAEQLGISRQYLWRLMQSRDRVSGRLLKKLGLMREVVRR